MGCCNCNKKDLMKVVQKYTFLTRLSEKLFEKSEELLEKTAKRQIIMAFKTLCNASKIYNQARECKEVAEKILREDICGNLCSRSNDNCQELKDSASEQFDLSEEYIDRAMCSLKNALNMIDKSIEAKEKGCILEARYEECIRNLDDTEVQNNTDCENNTDFLNYIDCLNSTEALANADTLSDTNTLSDTDTLNNEDDINNTNELNNSNNLNNSDCFDMEEEFI